MERTLVIHSLDNIGKEILLYGWVENLRKMGKITFIDLRDRTGSVQCIYSEKVEGLTLESVVKVTGKVNQRPENQINTDSETGTIEIEVTEIKLLNRAEALPIPVQGDGYDVNEEARLKYRYLDLRRKRMQKVLRLRSAFVRALRESLYKQDFIEVETPMLTASTKEGARDFVVPSRMNPGKFYALPQSPQQYKQLLMSAGVENYFQVARCIRDENLRADRGFEHSQIDVETSFRTQEEVRAVMERLVKEAISAVGGKIKPGDFPVLTYKEVLEKYGDDKFDIRNEEEKAQGILAFAWVTKYPMFKAVDKEDAAEVMDGKSGWTFTHNPFSGIIEEHQEWHLKGENIDKIEATQYDLVCNGYEIGSGSVRNHNPELLRATYKIMGYSPEETEASIGHMLKAFELGTPPHGGMALGIERLIMLLTEEKSLKETVAFPMTYKGNTAVMDAPGEVSDDLLEQLGISVIKKKGTDRGDEMLKQIMQTLEKSQISYDYLEHEPTPTSADSARVRGTKEEEGAKAIILRSKKNGNNIMLVLPGNKKIDFKKIDLELEDKFEFEKPEVIFEKFGLKVGGIPPFGNLLNLTTYFDSALLNNPKVAFNAGKLTCSIIMTSDDLLKAIEGKEGDWSN